MKSFDDSILDLEQAASRLAKSLQAKLFSRLAWLACFFELEKAWLAGPKLGLACKEKKLAYVRLGLACMKAWLDKTSLSQAFFAIETFIIRYHFLSEISNSNDSNEFTRRFRARNDHYGFCNNCIGILNTYI